MTIVLLLALIGEEQRFQNYQQIYDMKKVEQQLNSADRVFYLLNKPILYMTDDYAIFNNGGIIIEDKKNINRVEEKVQSIRNSRNFTYLIRVVTFEGKKWEIARINSKENDEKWKKFKKVLSDINTYLTMDKYYNVKNEEMENY